MSGINTSTNIMMNSTNVTMMNSIQNLDPIIGTLIDLITNTKHATDCKHVMAVALHQQGITTFDHLCEFPYSAEFHGRFSYYKQHDADVGTINSKDVFIIQGIKMYIQWLLLWCIHRKENKNDPKSNNPLEWTQHEFRHFKTGCRNYSITPTTGPTIGYDEYINNKNRNMMNDATVFGVDIDEVINKCDIISSNEAVVDNNKCNDDFPSLASDLSKKKKKKTPSSKNKKIPSSLMDLSNIPASQKKKILSTLKKKEEEKIPSTSKKKENDLYQVGVLYALDKEKQSKSSTLSNKMVSSTTTNLFKPDGVKRIVLVLPPETTNDSIISIEQTVDLVDSRNDLSKLAQKKRIDDLSKLETTEVAKKNFEPLSNSTSTCTSTSPISTSNVEVGFEIRQVSTTISHSMTTNINNNSDCSNFRVNINDVNHHRNNKYCVSTTKNSNDVAVTSSFNKNLTQYQDIPVRPKSIISRLEPVINNISNLDENNKYTPVDIINTYEFPVTVDVVTYNSNNADNNNNIADESADTSYLTINDTVCQPRIDDVDDVNDDDNNNNVVFDFTSSPDNTDAIYDAPYGEYNYHDDNDDDVRTIFDPCDVCFHKIESSDNNENDSKDISASVKVNQGSNQEISIRSAVIPSNNTHTRNTYSPSYVGDDIDNGEFKHIQSNDNNNNNNNIAAVTITNSNDDAVVDDIDHNTTCYLGENNDSVLNDEYDYDYGIHTNTRNNPNGEFFETQSVHKDNACMYNDDDNKALTRTSSLSTMINGEFAVFRSANRDDDNDSALTFVDSNNTGSNNDDTGSNNDDSVVDDPTDDRADTIDVGTRDNKMIDSCGVSGEEKKVKMIDPNDVFEEMTVNKEEQENNTILHDGNGNHIIEDNDNNCSGNSDDDGSDITDDDVNTEDDGSAPDNVNTDDYGSNNTDDDGPVSSIDTDNAPRDAYISTFSDDPRRLTNNNGEYNDKDNAPRDIPISIDSGSSTHNNNNNACYDACSDVITVDNNVYITTDTCSDAIDVGIHNNSDNDCSGAIDVGIHNNNEGYYFGTFDEVHYDDETASSAPDGVLGVDVEVEVDIDINDIIEIDVGYEANNIIDKDVNNPPRLSPPHAPPPFKSNDVGSDVDRCVLLSHLEDSEDNDNASSDASISVKPFKDKSIPTRLHIEKDDSSGTNSKQEQEIELAYRDRDNDIGPISVNDNIDIISSTYSSVDAGVLVYDIDDNNKNGNTNDDANTTSTCIDSTSTTNAFRDSDENEEDSEDFNAFQNASTNTSVYFDDSLGDNAPSDVSAYVPVKTDYTAINLRDLNDEDSILVGVTNVLKVTSGSTNNNDHDMFQFVDENMTTSDYNGTQDVPSTTPFSMNKQGFHLSSYSND